MTTPHNPIEQLILEQYPYPIAVRFADLLDTRRTYAARCAAGARTLEFGVRAIVLGMIANYVSRDIETMPNVELMERLHQQLNDININVASWVSIFDVLMHTYRQAREHFFMRELYDAYWRADHPNISERLSTLVQLSKQLSIELPTHKQRPDDDFRPLYTAFHEQLTALLAEFGFLTQYNVIRVDRYFPDGHCDYTLFRGTTRRRCSGALATQQPLQIGRLYLEFQNTEFLHLHPLLVDYPAAFEAHPPIIEDEQDLGLFSFYSQSGADGSEDPAALVSYSLPGLLQQEETSRTASEILHLLRVIRQHLQSGEDTREHFTWQHLRAAAEKITGSRMEAVRYKYNRDVYLQRQGARDALHQYLQTHGHCFVIIGKSGVGKTNFVLAEIREHLQTHEDTLVLIMDGGGQLSDRDIFETIYQDFAATIHIPHPDGMSPGDAFVHGLGRLPDINRKQVIIVLDAINESRHAVALMKSIDAWVSKAAQAGHTWLKFVVTSRPEAWRSIQVSVGRLTEQHYFRASDRGSMAFELHGFEMQEFDAISELEQVYRKYAAIYHISTPLTDLSPRLRDILRDPLALLLVMETYGSKAEDAPLVPLPPNISHYEIVDKYVASLRKSGIVKTEDFTLLTERLLPLMCQGDYENFLTRAAIMRTNDPVLADIIFDDSEIQMLDGRTLRVNQSFMNLVNAEILIREREGTGKNDKIRFKYERFYDYFMADYLREHTAGMSLDARKAFFVTLTQRLSQKAFLWGPLYTRLVDECQDDNIALLGAMAGVNETRVKDLVSSVLIGFGSRELRTKSGQVPRDAVNALCLALLETVPARGEISGAQIAAAEIAVKVADGLRLSDVIVTAILKPVDFIADAATEVLINLWCSHADDAPDDLDVAVAITWRILNALHWTRFGQLRKGLRSLVIMVFTVLFAEYSYKVRFPTILQHFRELVPAMLRKIPLIRFFVRSKRRKAGSGRGLRQRILLLIANWIIYTAKQVGARGRLMFDFESVTTFFNLSAEDKADYRRFIRYINPTPDMQLEDLRPLLSKRLADRQLIGAYIMTMGVMAFMPDNERAVNQLLTEIFEQGFEQLGRSQSADGTTGSFMLGTQLITLRNTMIADSGLTPENAENFRRVLEKVEEYFWSRFRSTTSVISWMDIGSYYYFARRLRLQHNYELLRHALRLRLQRGDLDGLLRFHHDLASTAWHVIYHSPELALDMLTVMHDELPAEIITQRHRDGIIIDFIQIRMADEYSTEMFLQGSTKMDEEMKQAIRTSKPQYNIGARVGVAGSWFGRDIMFDESPYMRKFLQYFLFTSLEARNERHWMTILFDVILSSLYEGQLVDIDSLLKPYLSDKL